MISSFWWFQLEKHHSHLNYYKADRTTPFSENAYKDILQHENFSQTLKKYNCIGVLTKTPLAILVPTIQLKVLKLLKMSINKCFTQIDVEKNACEWDIK